MPTESHIDALLPAEMARLAEDVGVRKAALPADSMLALAVLAGAFIGLGAMLSTIALTGTGAAWPFGASRLLAGSVFSLGLILVVVGGAELFTGNSLLIMAWCARKVGARALLRSWGIVYFGNFVGAIATALLCFVAGQYTAARGAVGATALSIANAKLEHTFVELVALGVLCNALVCLAVWLSFSARSTVDRIIAVVPPVAAFVAAGFEHSVANMYFFPLALFIKRLAPPTFWRTLGTTPAAFPRLTWRAFLLDNLLPVTLGNLLGGAVLVGLVYWFVYSRARPVTELSRND
ncbi:MAG TPA: formate transporter FocA [Polyangiaceae bacterium]|nr:formate transporter FocA [Polyangiaceae bacterium]